MSGREPVFERDPGGGDDGVASHPFRGRRAIRTALLGPAALVYGGAAAAHRAVYRHRLLCSERLRVPVISVGGLRVGGEGKTPIAGYLAAQLSATGRRVAIVCSGYRGRAGRRVVRVEPSSDPGWCGDEPVMLARRLPAVMVVRCSQKLRAAQRAVADGAEVVIVDDGFQHHRLHRDLDVLVEDGPAGWPLPAGPARELASAARHADLRWQHGRCGAELDVAVGPDIVSVNVPVALVDAKGGRVGKVSRLRGAPVFVVAGIARPAALSQLLQRCGATVVGRVALRDHGLLRAGALRRAAASGARWIVCSEKDIVRWGSRAREMVALRCEVSVRRGQRSLRHRLLQCCG